MPENDYRSLQAIKMNLNFLSALQLVAPDVLCSEQETVARAIIEVQQTGQGFCETG